MKKVIGIIIFVVLVGVAYYALSPLFKNVEVNDEMPTMAAVEVKTEGAANEAETPMEEAPEIDEQTGNQVSKLETILPSEVGEPVQPLGPFAVEGTFGHPASGSVSVFEGEETVIRFEDFKTINGPRLHVYLATDKDASDFIDLGPVRGTQGNINYVVPEGVDLDKYSHVLHWCVPFRVLFNYAEIVKE